MTDIHAHILPGIDDGAPDMRQALQMAELAVGSGVKTVVATPHCIDYAPTKNLGRPAHRENRGFSLSAER